MSRFPVGFSLVVPAGRLLGFLGRSGRQQQQPQAQAAPATPTPGDSTTQHRDTPPAADESLLESPNPTGQAAADARSQPDTQPSNTAATPQAPDLSSSLEQQAAVTSPTTGVTPHRDDVASPQGDVTDPKADADASSTQQAATPQAPLEPSLSSGAAEQAAAAAGTESSPSDAHSSVLSSQHGVSPHAPPHAAEEPTQQSSLGQHAAQQAVPGSSDVHEGMPASDAATQHQQSDAGEGAAGSEGMDRRQTRSLGGQAGAAEAPQEPALHSGLARHAASMEDGRSLLRAFAMSVITNFPLAYLAQSVQFMQFGRSCGV